MTSNDVTSLSRHAMIPVWDKAPWICHNRAKCTNKKHAEQMLTCFRVKNQREGKGKIFWCFSYNLRILQIH